MSGNINTVSSVANAVSAAVLGQNPTLPRVDPFKIATNYAESGYLELARGVMANNIFTDQQNQELEKTALENGVERYAASAITYYKRGDLKTAHLLITEAIKHSSKEGIEITPKQKTRLADIEKALSTKAKERGIDLQAPPLEQTEESAATLNRVFGNLESGNFQAARYEIQRNPAAFISAPNEEKFRYIELEDKILKDNISTQIDLALRQPSAQAQKYLLERTIKTAIQEEGISLTKEQKDRISKLNLGINLGDK